MGYFRLHFWRLHDMRFSGTCCINTCYGDYHIACYWLAKYRSEINWWSMQPFSENIFDVSFLGSLITASLRKILHFWIYECHRRSNKKFSHHGTFLSYLKQPEKMILILISSRFIKFYFESYTTLTQFLSKFCHQHVIQREC